jgi:hypothetical protein
VHLGSVKGKDFEFALGLLCGGGHVRHHS